LSRQDTEGLTIDRCLSVMRPDIRRLRVTGHQAVCRSWCFVSRDQVSVSAIGRLHRGSGVGDFSQYPPSSGFRRLLRLGPSLRCLSCAAFVFAGRSWPVGGVRPADAAPQQAMVGKRPSPSLLARDRRVRGAVGAVRTEGTFGTRIRSPRVSGTRHSCEGAVSRTAPRVSAVARIARVRAV